MNNKPLRIIITGGAGFIGTHLTRKLIKDPMVSTIYILDIHPPTINNEKIIFVDCDIRKPIKFSITKKVHCCFHLAAICREPGYEWEEYFDANYSGTKNVCKWASDNDIEHIIFTSTEMVFRSGEKRHGEHDTPDPDTAYGISKALAEEALIGWAGQVKGRILRIVRPGVVFGHNGGGNYVYLFKALKRNLFIFVGRKETVKSSIYVKDLVEILTFPSTENCGVTIFHAAYLEPTTISEICAAICKVYGWKRWIPTIPYRLALLAAMPFHALRFVGLSNPVHYRRIQKLYFSTNISCDEIQREGFVHKYPLTEAIADWRKDCGNTLF